MQQSAVHMKLNALHCKQVSRALKHFVSGRVL